MHVNKTVKNFSILKLQTYLYTDLVNLEVLKGRATEFSQISWSKLSVRATLYNRLKLIYPHFGGPTPTGIANLVTLSLLFM